MTNVRPPLPRSPRADSIPSRPRALPAARMRGDEKARVFAARTQAGAIRSYARRPCIPRQYGRSYVMPGRREVAAGGRGLAGVARTPSREGRPLVRSFVRPSVRPSVRTARHMFRDGFCSRQAAAGRGRFLRAIRPKRRWSNRPRRFFSAREIKRFTSFYLNIVCRMAFSVNRRVLVAR